MNGLITFNKEHNCGTTTSLDIAEKFSRQHKTILAAINNLEVSPDFIEQNFLPYSYIAKNGKSNPAYEITFDGFTLLAMGFTGKRAMKFKVDYIKAFRAMETKLKSLTTPTDKPVTVAEHTRALPSGKKEIVLSEKAKTEIGGIVKACLSSAFKTNRTDSDFAKLLAAEVTANMMYLKRDEFKLKAEEYQRKADSYAKAVREFDASLRRIEQVCA